jgi:hypothetical protein
LFACQRIVQIKESVLREQFGSAGPLADVYVPGGDKNFAFVTFTEAGDAKDAQGVWDG